MTDDDKLLVLKSDLQLLTNANDKYLKALLGLAAKAVEREGIVLTDGDVECDMAVIHYAAYLYRKRAAPDGGMPRFLRYELNNLLFSQKGAPEGDV